MKKKVTSDVEKLVISMHRLQKKNARGEMNVSLLKSKLS